MTTTTIDSRTSSTSHIANESNQWADVDHPLFYFDPGFKDFCNKQLDELSKLQPGWDNGRAPSINRDIIQSVRKFISSLPQHIATRPMVVPLSSGSVQLEWHHGRQVLELEFTSPDDVHFLKWDPENDTEEESTVAVASKDELVSLIRWFMEGMLNG